MIFLIEIGLLIGYISGKSENEIIRRSHLVCTLDNKEYVFYVDYDENNNIMYTEGSDYIFRKIVNKKEYTNSNNVINDIYNFFNDQNGICK